MNSFRKRAELFILEVLAVVLLAIIVATIAKLPEVAGEQQQTASAVKDVVETTTYVDEIEAIVSEDVNTIVTATTSTTTTTTTTREFNHGNNAFLTEYDLSLRFALGETWLNSSETTDGVNTWNSSDMGEIKETYYPCDLEHVFELYSQEIGYDYYSWVDKRSDGVWCITLGESEEDWLVCVAADLNVFSRGSLVRTSLGYGIVCDTGEFVDYEHGDRWFDIAVSSNSWGGTYRVFHHK